MLPHTRSRRPIQNALALAATLLLACVVRADVGTWSDAAWEAAKRADMAAFDAAMKQAPEGDSDAVKAVKAAIAQRDQHRMEAGKARDEAIAKHRVDLQKAMEAKDG
jgi:hypothetical protein